MFLVRLLLPFFFFSPSFLVEIPGVQDFSFFIRYPLFGHLSLKDRTPPILRASFKLHFVTDDKFFSLLFCPLLFLSILHVRVLFPLPPFTFSFFPYHIQYALKRESSGPTDPSDPRVSFSFFPPHCARYCASSLFLSSFCPSSP